MATKSRHVVLVQDTCGGRSTLDPLETVDVVGGGGDGGGGSGGGRSDAVGSGGGGGKVASDRTLSNSMAGVRVLTPAAAADVVENGTLNR